MPIYELQARSYELGRIRMGKRSDKGQPEKLDRFRLTSPDKTLIVRAAELYGGTPKMCDQAVKALEGHWEVTIEQETLPVVMGPNPPTNWMELWGRGTCKRKCDRRHEAIMDRPCICRESGEMKCKPVTRIGLILYELPGLGVWLLSSNGWGAAEILSMTAKQLLKWTAEGDLVPCVLAMEEKTKPGKRWMEPVLRVPLTPKELIERRTNAVLESRGLEPLDQAASKPLPAPEADPVAAARKRYFAIHRQKELPEHEGKGRDYNHRLWSAILKTDVDPKTYTLAQWRQLGDAVEIMETDELLSLLDSEHDPAGGQQ